MARKKTVSISTKPSAGTALLGVDDSAALSTQTAKPEFLAESPPDTGTATGAPHLNPIGLAVYGMVYCLSYSVVFSAILLGKIIPGSGLIALGLHDGAGAAQRSLELKPERYEESNAAGSAA